MLHLRDLERIMKGVANHRRIEILRLLNRQPGCSLSDIALILRANFKTIAEHVRRLHLAGLIEKRPIGAAVAHRPSRHGRDVLKFLRTLA